MHAMFGGVCLVTLFSVGKAQKKHSLQTITQKGFGTAYKRSAVTTCTYQHL